MESQSAAWTSSDGGDVGAPWAGGFRHLVQFYETDASLARTAGDFLAEGLSAGEAVVVIATEPHRRALLDELASRRLGLQAAHQAGRLELLDAERTLEEILVDGMPSWERFEALVGGALREASVGATRRVRAFGEMVDLLWQQERKQAALRLEELWNDLARAHDFSLLCAYTVASFYKEDGAPEICARHAAVLGPERGGAPGGAPPEDVRSLAAELSRRREVEQALRETVADLRKAEAVARDVEQELRDFAETAVVGLSWMDAAGTVLWANQAQLDMLGYRREEYVGHPQAELHVEEAAFQNILSLLLRDGEVRDVEVRLRASDGSIRDVQLSANAYRRDGRVAYYRCFSRDVTDRKRAENERSRLVSELERTVRLNEMFTAILGHDLRNPLHAIMTAAELALRRTTDERLTKPLQRVLSSGKRMAMMIGQLLDFTRAREGGLPLDRQPEDLRALVEEVRAEVELANPGRQVKVSAEGNLHGRWDRTRLVQALSNLIGNAVQHGQEGGPISVRLDGSSELSVQVEVHNLGAIPPDVLPDLFKPFRGSERPRDPSGGLGLGLYITEQVVRAHRGEISVTSTERVGTRFTLRLPRGGEGGAFASAPPHAPLAFEPVAAREPEVAKMATDGQLRLMMDSIRDYAIFMLDPQGHVRTWNKGAEHVLGYAPAEIIGRHFSTFYRPEDARTGAWERELELAQLSGHFEEEGWRVRRDGSQLWANVILTPVRDAAQRLVGFAKVTRDLTERKLAEEQLRQEQERFRLLVAGVKDYAIFMLDPTGRITTWNAGAERIKGYRAEEIIGQHFSRFYPPVDVLAGKPDYELEIAGREGRFEDEGWRLRKDGTRFWANVVITALRDPSGKLTGFAKVTRDLTERHRMEERLRQGWTSWPSGR